MRNDYFTLTEFARVVHAAPVMLKKIFAENSDFPVKRVGVQYVIPKLQFYKWYEAHQYDDAMRYRFDERSIAESMDEYIWNKLGIRVKRRFVV